MSFFVQWLCQTNIRSATSLLFISMVILHIIYINSIRFATFKHFKWPMVHRDLTPQKISSVGRYEITWIFYLRICCYISGKLRSVVGEFSLADINWNSNWYFNIEFEYLISVIKYEMHEFLQPIWSYFE